MRTATPLSESQLAAAALQLLAQPRRWQTLALPTPTPELAAQQPWTAYWATRLDAALPPGVARAILQQAHERFGATADATGALLSCAAVIETFYVEEGSLQPLDPWIERLQHTLPAAWASPELEAQVMACGLAIILRDQKHPLLADWAERGQQLVRQLQPGPVRVRLATFLVQYHLWRGEFGRTTMVIDALPGLDLTGLLPAEALLWHQSVASHARFVADHARGQQEVAAALALARSEGITQHDYALRALGVSLALADHDLNAAREHLAAMKPVLDQMAQDDQTHYWNFSAGLALLSGDGPQAVALARMTLANSLEIGGAYRTAAHRLSLGQILLAMGQPAAALQELDQASTLARQIDAGLLAFSAGLFRASCLLELGQYDAADAGLRDDLPDAARHDYRTTAGWWLPLRLARVLQQALAADIEPAWCRAFIRRRRLVCPDPHFAAWPWPLKLLGLGELQVLLHDEPLPRGSGKTSQRPLDLLRALLAHAPAPLPVATAVQWIWPDTEAADQRKAFDVALLRLRRLLGDERLLQLEGSRLSLNADWTWTDAGAFLDLLQRIGSAQHAERAQLLRWGDALLALARGPLLEGDEADWVRAARSRFRQRFVLSIGQLSLRLADQDVDAAIHLLERALDADPASESIAVRLVRLHVSQGRRSEAARVLNMCSAMRSLGEGLPLSPETRALALELGLPAP